MYYRETTTRKPVPVHRRGKWTDQVTDGVKAMEVIYYITIVLYFGYNIYFEIKGAW